MPGVRSQSPETSWEANQATRISKSTQWLQVIRITSTLVWLHSYSWPCNLEADSANPCALGWFLNPSNRECPSWRQHVRAALSSSTHPLPPKVLSDELISWLISSLFGTEASHPECRGISQQVFEFSRAPKLLKFLYIYTKLAVSSRDQPLNWEVVLAIVAIFGYVVQLFIKQEAMLSSITPTRFAKWSQLPLFRQFLEEAIMSTSSQTEGAHDAESAVLPNFIITNLQKAAHMLKEGDSDALPRFLDGLAEAALSNYVLEPAQDDWLRESSRPILDLNVEAHRHHHRRHHELDVEWVGDLGMPQVLRDFSQVQFSPETLSLERLRKMDKSWKVVWTSSLARHLVIREQKTIYVYWPSTTLTRLPRCVLPPQ